MDMPQEVKIVTTLLNLHNYADENAENSLL